MNRAEFVSHVAAETSTTRAGADWMVGAVFPTIAAIDGPNVLVGGRYESEVFFDVSGQSEACLSPGAQCGGSWLRCPSADGKGS